MMGSGRALAGGWLLLRLCGDLLWLMGAVVAAYWLRFFGWEIFNWPPPAVWYPWSLFLPWGILFLCCTVLVLGLLGRYQFLALPPSWSFQKSIFAVLGGGGIFLLGVFLSQESFFSRLIFVLLILFSTISLVLSESSWKCVYWWGQKKISLGRRLIIVSDTGQYFPTEAPQALISSVVGWISTQAVKNHKTISKTLPFPQKWSVQELEKLPAADEIWVCSAHLNSQQRDFLLLWAQHQQLTLRFWPSQELEWWQNISAEKYAGVPTWLWSPTPLSGWAAVGKRLFDLVGSALGLLLGGVFILLLSGGIWLTAPRHSPWYGSLRMGRKGQIFTCWKLRTMVPQADQQLKKLKTKNERAGAVFFKMKDDPRVTRFGAFLRRWSLDELPQLWNVFRGEMSLIGPRPHLPQEVAQYPDPERQLLFIRPGLVGYSQTFGALGLNFSEELRLEKKYLQQWSWELDLIILWRAAGLILRGKNY